MQIEIEHVVLFLASDTSSASIRKTFSQMYICSFCRVSYVFFMGFSCLVSTILHCGDTKTLIATSCSKIFEVLNFP
jgi:hypothetical protein